MHFKKLSIYLTWTFIYAVDVVESFKFLAILPTPFKSHFIFGSALMKGLALKGHEVYVISPFPQKESIKNYHDVPFSTAGYMVEDNKIIKIHASNGSKEVVSYTSCVTPFAIFESRHVQMLMKSHHKFDAVLCEVFNTEALFGFSEHFKAPLIGLSSFGNTAWNTDMVGSPTPLSYVPDSSTRYSDHMDILSRAININVVITEAFNTYFYSLPLQADLYKRYFPHLKSDMYTVRKNAAAILVNTHASLSYSRPYAPNHIPVGGLHIDRQRKTLPQDIEAFIEGAKYGVVYVSLGTNDMIANMVDFKTEMIFTALTKLDQRVLWKHDDPVLEGRHFNILIRRWFPQEDILAHEKVRLFITQGGRLSTIETIYYGKPIVGIPVIGDQIGNVAKAAADGIGIELDFKTLSSDKLLAAIKRVITNETFTQRAKEMSARYRDQPILPLDLAIHWVEHVARQKGAKYLHCTGLDLMSFQYHNLDAIVVLCGALLLLVYFVYFHVIFVVKLIRRTIWLNIQG